MEMKFSRGIKFLICFSVAYFTFFYLMVVIHESGHLIFGTIVGGQFQAMVLNFPFLFATSYVTMTFPGATANVVFLIGGTLFTLTVGVILTFLPTLYPKVMGWILMIDGILNPLRSFIASIRISLRSISFMPPFSFL